MNYEAPVLIILLQYLRHAPSQNRKQYLALKIYKYLPARGDDDASMPVQHL